jgi:hypothetical protein
MISSSGQLFTTASSAIGGGSTINNFYNTASFMATGSVTASVNVGTGNVFTVTSASANLMTVSSSGMATLLGINVTGVTTAGPGTAANLIQGSSLRLVHSNIAQVTGGLSFQYTGNQAELIDLSPTITSSTSAISRFILSTATYRDSPSYPASIRAIDFRPTLNLTSSYTGSIIGLYYAPTITAITSQTTHSAIWTTTGDVLLNTTSGNTVIGNDNRNTGYKLMVSGSGTSGSFNANNVLYVSASNIGINTTPLSAWDLDIKPSNTSQGGVGKFRVGNNISDVLTAAIGSNSQGYSELYLNGQTATLGLYCNPNTGGGYVGSNNTLYSTGSVGLIAGGFPLVLGAGSNEKMRIHTTGDVSIGLQANNITGSGYRLMVTGSGTSGSFNANNTLYVSGSRVGIGTPTPKAPLEINLSGSTGQPSIIISGSAQQAGAIILVDTLGAGGGVGNLIRVNDSTSNPTTNFFILKANSNNYRGFEQSYYESTARFGILGAPFTGLAIYSGLATEVARFAANAGNLLLNKASDSGQRLQVAGTTLMSSSVNVLTVQGSGSSAPLFTVQGSQGELFAVTDSLTGSLFSVNDISGLPILDVNSDQTVKIGNYLAPGLYTSTRITANTGVTVIYGIPTASYDSAYFDYNIRSGSVGRAGSIIAMWSGSSVNYSEVSASSFGTTNTFVFGVQISGSNMILSGSAPSNGWTVKTIIRSI